jgi:hypothetical protein
MLGGLGAAGREASAQTPVAQAGPRLSRLDIALWPEFDRPLTLVIIQGELAPDTALPARLTFHIPSAAGEPHAVASGAGPGAGLINREYQTTTEGDSLVVTLETPDPIVHLEFYVPLTRDGLQREFTYIWPGDLAVDSVTLRAQIPVGAQDFQTEPLLGLPEVGADGLGYRETTLGALEAGQTLSFRLQYSKEDPRLTAETLPSAQPDDDGGGVPLGWPALAVMAAVVLVGVAALAWYRYSQRQPMPVRLPRGPGPGKRGAGRAAAYCTQCGQALSPGDRFCSQCGTPVRRR